MASFLKKLKKRRQTTAWRIGEGVVYAAMLILVMIYFTGNGQFIYEAF